MDSEELLRVLRIEGHILFQHPEYDPKKFTGYGYQCLGSDLFLISLVCKQLQVLFSEILIQPNAGDSSSVEYCSEQSSTPFADMSGCMETCP